MFLKHCIGAALMIIIFYHLQAASALPLAEEESALKQGIKKAENVALKDAENTEGEIEEGVRTFGLFKGPRKFASNIAHTIGNVLYKEPYDEYQHRPQHIVHHHVPSYPGQGGYGPEYMPGFNRYRK